jgi:hypothetical protein
MYCNIIPTHTQFSYTPNLAITTPHSTTGSTAVLYLSYQPARLHRLAESIPGLHKGLQNTGSARLTFGDVFSYPSPHSPEKFSFSPCLQIARKACLSFPLQSVFALKFWININKIPKFFSLGTVMSS